jgi:hypothetical protein
VFHSILLIQLFRIWRWCTSYLLVGLQVQYEGDLTRRMKRGGTVNAVEKTSQGPRLTKANTCFLVRINKNLEQQHRITSNTASLPHELQGGPIQLHKDYLPREERKLLRIHRPSQLCQAEGLTCIEAPLSRCCHAVVTTVSTSHRPLVPTATSTLITSPRAKHTRTKHTVIPNAQSAAV